MTPKQSKLEHVKTIWKLYEEAQRETDLLRLRLVEVAKAATEYKATQQEIADQTSLSRQRIQQLLKKEAI